MMNPHTCKIEPEWIDWAQQSVDALRDDAHLCMPLVGVIFKLDKPKKKLVTLAEIPAYRGSDTDILNHRTFGEIGYTIERPDDVITDEEQAIKLLHKIETESESLAIDVQMKDFFTAMREMFLRRN